MLKMKPNDFLSLNNFWIHLDEKCSLNCCFVKEKTNIWEIPTLSHFYMELTHDKTTKCISEED